ncbi:hypothetical protein VSR82_38040 [Burkholderia sp. JPY481]|uniref:hypothetical protein n=1 Tax=Paraburkholderia sp. EG304 TaxID=3237015 RepID=UPI00317D2D39
MITLNGDKELIRVGSWEDIQARPDFDGQLDPAAHELAAIIGSYVFPDYIACGLSNCRTKHGRGYLVATKDARVTNIGKDCGARYFGVDFEDMSWQFDKDIAAKENRERLWSFAFRIDTVSVTLLESAKGREATREQTCFTSARVLCPIITTAVQTSLFAASFKCRKLAYPK